MQKKNSINIAYWSPFLGRVATIRSVLNSIISLTRYSKKKYRPILINCFGEWNNYKKEIKRNKIDYINLQENFSFSVDTYGFFKSRIIYLITFLISYNKLKIFLKKNRPKYLIVHLLTFVPFILFLFNDFETKLVLRISGKPKLNFFRKILWILIIKKISLIFCPTRETINKLKKIKAFSNKKIIFLPDPVIDEKKNILKSNNSSTLKLNKEDYFLSIGRLTRQKNHDLLIDFYKKNRNLKKLIIIGDGELKKKLIKKIKINKLEKKISIFNYKNNIFDYIKKSNAVIIPSLWEDPGFVMIEAAYLKKSIICSNCSSGPKEFLQKNDAGFLFKNNDLASLKKTLENYEKTSKRLKNKKIQTLIRIQKFTQLKSL